MNATNETKINRLLQLQPSGAIFLSSWMKQNGISYELQRNYIKSGWFVRIASGVVIRKGESPSWQSALHSINHQTSINIHVGAKSALSLQGYAHYLELNEQKIELFSPQYELFPHWFKIFNWNIQLNLNRTNFLTTTKGLMDYKYNQLSFPVSTPARALLECLFLSTDDYDLVESYQTLETLTTLLPNEVQELLENCNSVKVIRLFLYMSEKAKHSWFKYLDLSKLEMGKGKRMFSKSGVYIKSHQIIVPKALADL